VSDEGPAPGGWVFRLQIKLGANYYWKTTDPEAARATIDYRGHTITVKSAADAPLMESQWVVFVGKGFASRDEAERVGRTLKEHLRVASVWSNMPIDVGETDRVLSRIGPGFPVPQGVEIIPEIHGLSLFVDTGNVRVVRSGATLQSHQPLDRFAADLAEIAEHPAPNRDRHLARACDFYIGATSSIDLRSQFLMLIASLEQLANQVPRPPEVVQLVNQWIGQVADLSDRAQRQSLRTSLEYLRKESIGAAIRSVVIKHVTPTDTIPNPVKFVSECYTMRSNLSHGTNYVPVDDIRGRLPLLYGIVRQAIKGAVAAPNSTADS
jgi:hypothetical protein